MTAQDDVGVEVVVDDAGRSAAGRPAVLRLGWSRADPLAVRLTVRGVPDHPALYRGTWTILRDFLRYGLDEATGDGDVRISPDEGDVRFDLGEIGGRACVLRIPAGTLHGFLCATEAIVPSGEESNDEAIDALIERLQEL